MFGLYVLLVQLLLNYTWQTIKEVSWIMFPSAYKGSFKNKALVLEMKHKISILMGDLHKFYVNNFKQMINSNKSESMQQIKMYTYN